MSKLYLDSETCGLHSMPVLLQYAVDDSMIHLYDIWKEPVGCTLRLLEWIADHTVVGFNLVFDWFHIVKLYTIWDLLPVHWIPEEHIDEIAAREAEGQEGSCLKPRSALDLLLYSRRGPYQSLMGRNDIRIRKVPAVLAGALAMELENRVKLDGIYFARSKQKDAPRWKVYDRKDDPHFRDVVLKFHPAGGLKYLAEHALKITPKYHYADVEPPKDWQPTELGYAPTAHMLSDAWPSVIVKHIDWWAYNGQAREYATDDIVYTRKLDEHFGYPEPGDDDSVLACMVPIIRWRGYRINVDGLKQLLQEANRVIKGSPINVNKPSEVRAYLEEAMDDVEKLTLKDSTDKATLKRLINKWPDHPAAQRAQEILTIKARTKEKEQYEKLIHAGKFHANFSVGGTKSWRMSGGSTGLNSQAIKSTDEVRSQFPLAWDGYQLCGGDFDGFEITLADAVYNDPDLRTALKSGQSIHAMFGAALYDMTYEELNATKGTEDDKYKKAKTGVFGLVYGGDWSTLVKNLGVSEKQAQRAEEWWETRFAGVGKRREMIKEHFGCLVQPGGIGTQVFWREPREYCETFLGFRRYFTLENTICRALTELANSPPKRWHECEERVYRRNRVQTAAGAVSSALYAAAFSLASANVRAAGNHEIQSPGGMITKSVQRAIWDLQPHGVHELVVAPMNVHDEVMCVTAPDHVERVVDTVTATVERYREHVPLIGISWHRSMDSWADK